MADPITPPTPEAPVEPVKEEKSESQKMKEENDAVEAELVRKQKLRNETLLAGDAGGAAPKKEEKEETNADYATKVQAGELNGP